MNINLSRLMFMVAALAVALIDPAPVNAQNQSQWDSLFDRIIRLEANVRNMQSGAGGQTSGGAGSAQTQQRLNSLENQMQQLLGEVRIMNERLRKMETNGQSGSVPAPNRNKVVHGAAPQQGGGIPITTENFNDYAQDTLVVERGPATTGSLQQSQGPQTLGTLRVPATQNAPLQQQGGVPQYNESVEVATLDGQSVSGISSAAGPQQLYEQSYESIRKKKYSAAETGFREFLNQYSGHSLAGNAQYWLGQSYYARKKYQAAAQEFLTGYRSYKNSKKAPASLLKLAMSLNKLGKKEQACAAYSQVRKQYPKAKSEQKRALKEYRRAGC